MKILLVINDAPYGTEKAYNALRIAMNLQKNYPEKEVNVFLLADSVSCAVSGQETARGYYNVEKMLKSVLNKGGSVKACGTCASARGLEEEDLLAGVEISNMNEFTAWIVEADRVMTF